MAEIHTLQALVMTLSQSNRDVKGTQGKESSHASGSTRKTTSYKSTQEAHISP
jgi:hypothetical protein